MSMMSRFFLASSLLIYFKTPHTAWDHVSPDLVRLFEGFHAGEVELGCLNRAHIALLPKAEGIPGPGSFRPVSLQNCSMKMICKALTTRLQNQIPLLVDADQSGFVAGRSDAW
jgi:hypothetical protein